MRRMLHLPTSVRAPPDASTRPGSVLAQLAFAHPSMLEFRASSAKGCVWRAQAGSRGCTPAGPRASSARSPWSVLIYNINFVSIGLMTLFALLLIPAFLPGQRAARIPDAPRRGAADVDGLRDVLGGHASLRRRLRVRQPHARAGDGHDVQLEPDGVVGAVRGVPSAFFAFYGLTPLFRSLGVLTGNQGLIDFGDDRSTPTGAFIAGTLLIVALVAIFAMGLNRYFRVQNVLFVAVVGRSSRSRSSRSRAAVHSSRVSTRAWSMWRARTPTATS